MMQVNGEKKKKKVKRSQARAATTTIDKSQWEMFIRNGQTKLYSIHFRWKLLNISILLILIDVEKKTSSNHKSDKITNTVKFEVTASRAEKFG